MSSLAKFTNCDGNASVIRRLALGCWCENVITKVLVPESYTALIDKRADEAQTALQIDR